MTDSFSGERLLFILPTEGFSGAEKYILEYCLHRLSKGDSCTVLVAADRWEAVSGPFLEKGIPVMGAKKLNRGVPRGPRSQILFWSGVYSVTRQIRSFDRYIVNFAWPCMGATAVAALSFFHKPVRCIFHLVGEDYVWAPFSRWLMRRLLRKPESRAICVAQSVATRLARGLDLPNDKFEVCYNGVSLDKSETAFMPKESAQSIFDEGVSILTVASVYPHKGCFEWVRIAEEIVKNHPEVHFYWAGGGDFLTELKAVAYDSFARSNLHILGKRSDVPQLLEQVDVFLFLSALEGHPFSVLEAMLAGRLVISTDVDGIGETIRSGEEALLFRHGDWARITAAIKRYIEEPDRYSHIALAGQVAVKKRMSLEAATERLDQMIG